MAVAEAVVTARPPRAIAPPASTAAQRISLWVSAVFGGFLLLAFLLMPGFFPPMSPRMSAQATAAYYADTGSSPRTGIAVAGLLLGSVKVNLVVQNFMEVRTAPRWLKLFTGVWLVVLSATILGLYLAA